MKLGNTFCEKNFLKKTQLLNINALQYVLNMYSPQIE
jgi:hypothetical protein